MAIYKFRLFGAAGKVVAVQRISALTDDEALSIAHDMIKGAPIASFDLWEGERRVHGTAPTMRQGKPRPVS